MLRTLVVAALLAAGGWVAAARVSSPATTGARLVTERLGALGPSRAWSAAADSAAAPKKKAAGGTGSKSTTSKSATGAKGSKSGSASKGGDSGAPAAVPKDAAARSALFKKECLETHVALAKEQKPYLVLDAESGELRLLIRGLVLARYPAEATLPGRNLNRLIHQKAPSSALCKPFEWVGFEKRATPEAVEALTVKFDPPLRIDFQTSPSDFAWMRLRRKITDSLPWGKESGLSIMLFHDAESLAAVAPILADSLPLVFALGN